MEAPKPRIWSVLFMFPRGESTVSGDGGAGVGSGGTGRKRLEGRFDQNRLCIYETLNLKKRKEPMNSEGKGAG